MSNAMFCHSKNNQIEEPFFESRRQKSNNNILENNYHFGGRNLFTLTTTKIGNILNGKKEVINEKSIISKKIAHLGGQINKKQYLNHLKESLRMNSRKQFSVLNIPLQAKRSSSQKDISKIIVLSINQPKIPSKHRSLVIENMGKSQSNLEGIDRIIKKCSLIEEKLFKESILRR